MTQPKADLFTKELTKRQQVFDFIKNQIWVKTHEVIAFGLSIGLNRADREARLYAQEAEEYFLKNGHYSPEGYIRRMPEGLKKLRFPRCKEDIWEFVGGQMAMVG